MKYFFCSVFTLCFSLAGISQITFKGILEEKIAGLKVGDTVEVYGKSRGPTYAGYVGIKTPNDRFKPVTEKKVRVLGLEELDFWSKIYFDYAGFSAGKSGWKAATKRLLADHIKARINNFEEEGAFYAEKYVQDFLQQMVLAIYPHPIIKRDPVSLTIKLVDIEGMKPILYDDGSFIVPINWLVKQNSKQEVHSYFTAQVAHSVLNHSFTNLESFDFASENMYAFTQKQRITAKHIARKYLAAEQIKQDQPPNQPEKDRYTRTISTLISHLAWQEFFKGEYNKALEMVDRLIMANIASEIDLLLKARIYRHIYSSRESNLTALRIIENAEALSINPIQELYAEKGLLYMRLENWEAASQAFSTYYSKLAAIGDLPEEMRWARLMIHKCNQFINLK